MRSAMRGRASHLCLVRFDLYLGGPLDGCRRDFEIACIVSRALWDTRFPFQSDRGTDVRHSTNAQFAGSFNAGKLSAGFLFHSGFQVRGSGLGFEGNGSNEFHSDLIKLLGWIFFEGIDDPIVWLFVWSVKRGFVFSVKYELTLDKGTHFCDRFLLDSHFSWKNIW